MALRSTPALLGILLALAAGCSSPAVVVAPAEGAPPAFPMPLWLDATHAHGLAWADGVLVAGEKRLVLDPPEPGFHAAAYHESAKLATVVTTDGAVVLYEERRGRLREVARRAAPEGKTYRLGQLTRVPGLAYVLDVDVAYRSHAHDPREQSADGSHLERVAVTPSAEPWVAITTFTSEDEVMHALDRTRVLEGVYRTEPGALWLSLEPGQWRRLSLPSPLDAPTIWNLLGWTRQAVFNLGEHGIVCKLVGGWAAYAADGTLLGSASTAGTPEG